MKSNFVLLLGVALLVACHTTAPVAERESTGYTQYVDPFIGSGGHGHVFVGIGRVQSFAPQWYGCG